MKDLTFPYYHSYSKYETSVVVEEEPTVAVVDRAFSLVIMGFEMEPVAPRYFSGTLDIPLRLYLMVALPFARALVECFVVARIARRTPETSSQTLV